MVLFAGGCAADAPGILEREGWGEYDLLTTTRALADSSPALGSTAPRILEVAHGQVPGAAARVLERGPRERLVALGGGRAIDVAKAAASVSAAQVCAIPTTLSGAEMTRLHRPPAGREEGWPGPVRPALVLADPEAMTSAPEPLLRASAVNSLSHGIESLTTPRANPLASTAALAGIAMVAAALDEVDRRARDRRRLAFGSILCAYALDSAGYGVHHVLCQSTVRIADAGHAETYAALLPHTVELLGARAPEQLARVAEAFGATPAELPERIAALGGGARSLGDLGVERSQLGAIASAAASRPELRNTPQPPGEAELEALLDAAW